MIISHRHRFIFIHCRKTAGSAIKSLLARQLGPQDLQIGCWGDAVAAGAAPNRRFVADVFRPTAAGEIVKATLRQPRWWWSQQRWSVLNSAQKKLYKRRLKASPAHPPAERIRAFAREEFACYTKFCVVRNPYEKVVSDYFWRCGVGPERPSMRSFLESLSQGVSDARAAKFDNWSMYTIDDQLVVDRVARYESLASDLGRILGELGVAYDCAGLPTAKDIRGCERESARSWFGSYERALVESMYGREMVTFGYTFDNARI
jgi:hypothetical protein